MYRIGKKIIRINVENDAREDTPIELKQLITACTEPDVEKRILEFSNVKKNNFESSYSLEISNNKIGYYLDHI